MVDLVPKVLHHYGAFLFRKIKPRLEARWRVSTPPFPVFGCGRCYVVRLLREEGVEFFLASLNKQVYRVRAVTILRGRR